mmetsp:Transcript_9358/g.15405  ORF Transcript_9358/g.15405 Transcript_9358/m.15405 type:complete len:322 (+) Transcript_9358:53-1018(+)
MLDVDAHAHLPEESAKMNPPVKVAVIPIAGLGTRLYPTTKVVPKAFFPVPSSDGFFKPVIQHIMEEALSAGIEEICVVCSVQQREELRKYFEGPEAPAILAKPDFKKQADRLADLGKRLKYAIQEKPLGFGHAILCAREAVGKRPFLVFLGDHVYLPEPDCDVSCARQLVDIYERTGLSCTTLGLCREKDLSANGIVCGAPHATEPRTLILTDTVEKPDVEVAKERLTPPKELGIAEGYYLCYFGIDLFSSDAVFDALETNMKEGRLTKNELQLRDAMYVVMKQHGMLGYQMKGKRYDTGMPLPYAETVMAFGKRYLNASD